MKWTSDNVTGQNPFQKLTWADIEQWAGPTIVSRGRSYQRSGAVQELATTKDNTLVAWVQGSFRYATTVKLDGHKPVSLCTCPYGFNCKHGVAVVLEYLESVKHHKNIPIVSDSDERIRAIERGEEPENDGKEDDMAAGFSETAARALNKKTKSELVTLLLEMAEKHQPVRDELLSKLDISSTSQTLISKTVSMEIDRASKEPGWQNHWRHEGFTPDYSQVRSGLQQLFKAGRYDEIIELGKKLFRQGLLQIGQSNDDGETLAEIHDTLAIVFKALPKCSLADVDKMELAVDWELLDSYGLADHLQTFWQKAFNKHAWEDLADRLLERLNALPAISKDTEFRAGYQRSRLTDQIARALAGAGSQERLLQLYIQEAPLTHSYERLVDLLIKTGKTADAEKWIRTGFQATHERWPGIAAALRRQLYLIYANRRNWTFCAAIKADEFFEQSALTTYSELKKAGEKAGAWSTLRPFVIDFLNSGTVPKAKRDGWPLPEVGMQGLLRRPHANPPFTNVLLEIALHEKNLEEAMRLYTQWQHPQQGAPSITINMENYYGEKVANAVKQRYPDDAIAIWKRLADNHIGLTNVKEYRTAVRYLGKMLQVMINNDREQEARIYIAALRARHIRKIRLVEMLDSLSGKRITEI